MWKRNHSLPEQIERGLVMNENLFRPQFDTLKLSDKLWLMQTLATRYHLTFKELYAFSRWGQSCTTGLFESGGMGPLLGYLPCSPHCKPEAREDNEIHNDYDVFRPVIRVQMSGWRMVSPGDER